MLPSDPQHAPPSYAEMKKPKPKPTRVVDGITPNKPLPLKLVICEKCHRVGGTLVNVGTHKEPHYQHEFHKENK